MSEGLKFKTDMQFVYGVPAELAPGVARVVANNASAFTFKGTNTYLVGTQSLAVIDPGPADPEHISAILRAAGRSADNPHPGDACAPRPRRGRARAAGGDGREDVRFPPRKRIADSADAQATSEYISADYSPDVHLKHGDRLKADDWELSALHTPGHAPDHLCFALEGRGLVFSGDHVMAWNTSVVAPPEGRMADYLRSLEFLLERDDEMLLPGHGGRVMEPRRVVKAYLLHRRWREQAILEAVRKGSDTVRKLLPVIYRDLDAEVAGAAMLSLRAHMEHLHERGLVKSTTPRTSIAPLFLFSVALDLRGRGLHLHRHRFQAHYDFLEDRADALRVAAEVVAAVARRRPDVDVRCLIVAADADHHVIVKTEHQCAVDEFD